MKKEDTPWTTDEATGAKALKLAYVVEHDGEKITQITFRRPKLRDLEAAEKQPRGGERDKRMYANLAELDPALFEELDLFDWDRLGDMYSDFLAVPGPGRS